MTVLFNIVVLYLIKPTFLLDKGNDDHLDKLMMIMLVVVVVWMIPWFCYKRDRKFEKILIRQSKKSQNFKFQHHLNFIKRCYGHNIILRSKY